MYRQCRQTHERNRQAIGQIYTGKTMQASQEDRQTHRWFKTDRQTVTRLHGENIHCTNIPSMDYQHMCLATH